MFFKKTALYSLWISKITYQNTLWQSICWNVANTCKIFVTALLSYFFITLRKTEFENVSVSEMWNLRRHFEDIESDGKYTPCYSELLQEPIQLQISKKLTEIVAPFLKSTSIFENVE